ncbi:MULTISPECIES: hypothetical protein [Paenibacillus]|nr:MULTISPECIES: hypothetical protein [Paenibacillus]
MAKKPKVQENYQTPNEKYNAEFAVENDGATKAAAKPAMKPSK